MKKIIFALLTIAVTLGSTQAFADQIEDLQNENAMLRQRVEKMEATLQQLCADKAAAPSGKPAVSTSKCAGMEIYGYIKADAAYDTQRTMIGNFNMWVLPEAGSDDDNQFNLTAKQTRFGIKAFGPGFAGGDIFGKIEMDFYGSGAENKAELRMRHAYVQMDWDESDISLLAGQTWDVVSPLNAPTINFLPLGHCGNTGYRRPQVRLSKGFEVGESSILDFQVAASRTIGDIWGADVRDTGEDAGIPTFQGRAALSLPLMTEKNTTIGVSGHWGREDYEQDTPVGSHKEFDTWMVCLDLTLPVTDVIKMQGEIWTGENLDSYLGGIGQGVNQTTLKEIAGSGGWAALTFGPFEQWLFNVGGGYDKPDKGDLNDGMRDKNFAVFGNTWYSFSSCLKLGLELSYWKTEYKNSDDGDSVRVQGAIQYIF